jgi:Tfp pilus assembly protein PilZ
MGIRENQSHPRTLGRLRVRFGIEKPERSAFTMNVSQTGAFIHTNQVYPPGKTIKVEFNFPDRSISVHAHVVWAKRVPREMAHLLRCGMGVRFINPGPEWVELFDSWESGKRFGA